MRFDTKNYVKEFREKHKMTQQELADECKVGRSTISEIESGKYVPPVDIALKISEFFNVTVNEIFTLI